MESFSHSHETPNRTPRSQRSYLISQNRLYNTQSAGNGDSIILQEHSATMSDNKGVIYGTNIDSVQVIHNIEKFIREFEIILPQNVAKRIYFEDMKDLLWEEERTLFPINGSHIMEYDLEMYYQLIYFPAEMICCFDQCLKKVFESLFQVLEMD